MARRVVLIVLDSFSIGEEPDVYLWNEGPSIPSVRATSFRNPDHPSIPAFLISRIACLQGQICAYVPVTVLDHTQATSHETEMRHLTLAAA